MPRASEATPWVKARSLVTPCKGRSFIYIFKNECFCPYRASILWQSVTQGVASLALGAFGLSARALSAASQQFKQTLHSTCTIIQPALAKSET